MLDLFIIRHGETVWNTQKRLQGQLDSNLTERGRNQAAAVGRALGKELQTIGIESFHQVHFVSSDLGRAKNTGDIIRNQVAEFYGSEISDDLQVSALLREWSMGAAEGKTLSELKEHEPMLWKAFLQKKNGISLPGDGQEKLDLGETLEEQTLRTKQGLITSIQSALSVNAKAAVIISHGGTIKNLLVHHVLENDHSNFKVRNSSLTHFEVKQDHTCENIGYTFLKKKFMCTDHLSTVGVL